MFSKLVEARTFSERMFEVITLAKLNKHDSQEAITEPLKDPMHVRLPFAVRVEVRKMQTIIHPEVHIRLVIVLHIA